MGLDGCWVLVGTRCVLCIFGGSSWMPFGWLVGCLGVVLRSPWGRLGVVLGLSGGVLDRLGTHRTAKLTSQSEPRAVKSCKKWESDVSALFKTFWERFSVNFESKNGASGPEKSSPRCSESMIFAFRGFSKCPSIFNGFCCHLGFIFASFFDHFRCLAKVWGALERS